MGILVQGQDDNNIDTPDAGWSELFYDETTKEWGHRKDDGTIERFGPSALTSIALVGNDLTYRDEDGVDTIIDLSPYVDDTNLSRIVSASLNASTGIATFTRDDASDFTVDFSGLKDRANHTGTQVAATISDFDTEVSNNVDVTANTAKVSNVTHTGEISGTTILAVDPTAISNKASLASPTGAEEILINDGGTLKKTTAQDIADLGGGGGGGGIDLDRSYSREDSFKVNTTADYTTETTALALTHTFTAAYTGEYKYNLEYGWSNDSGTFDQEAKVEIDTTVSRVIRIEAGDAGGVDGATGVDNDSSSGGSSGTDQRLTGSTADIFDTVASTSYTITFYHRPTSTGVESTIKWSLLTVERWS